MKRNFISGKLLVYTFLGIMCFQFSFPTDPDITRQILGKWEFGSFTYRGVGRYGQKEVNSIKSSVLCFNKDKIYFTNLKFIDTCFYTEMHPKAFFDREDKDVSYFQDGPLAIKYSREKLSKFIRIDLNCKENGFGTFYLNGDTLILKSLGGVTFFFTKNNSDNLNGNIDKGK